MTLAEFLTQALKNLKSIEGLDVQRRLGPDGDVDVYRAEELAWYIRSCGYQVVKLGHFDEAMYEFSIVPLYVEEKL